MKKYILTAMPIIIVLISVFLDELSPLEQALYFLILFLMTCLSIYNLGEILLIKSPSLQKKIDRIKPPIGIILGLIGLSIFAICFIFIFNSFSGVGILNSFITLLMMYAGLIILVFIVSCFIEGITRQKKTDHLKASILFISVSYVVLTTFGIMQLISQSN